MLAIVYDNEEQAGDLVALDGALGEGLDLYTACALSLFCDAPARPEDRLPADVDRRGWWADAYADAEGDAFGSRLWLLHRAGASKTAVPLAKQYAEEALAWLVRDGIAESVEVATERRGVDGISIAVVIKRPGDLAPSLAQVWTFDTETLGVS
jgi:phage gp46-like protein